MTTGTEESISRIKSERRKTSNRSRLRFKRGASLPPRVKFTIRLGLGQNVDKVRSCIEVTLGTKLAETFPNLLRFKDSIWSYDTGDEEACIKEHYVDEVTLEERKRELAEGRPVGLPIRLEEAAPEARKFTPRIGKEITEQRFLVLTLPIFMRNHRRKACGPGGTLFDAVYSLRNSCGFASITCTSSDPI